MIRQIQFTIRNYQSSSIFTLSSRSLQCSPSLNPPKKSKSTTPVGKHDQGPVSDAVSTSNMKKPSGPKGPIPQSYSRAEVSEDIEQINHELGWKNKKTGEYGGPKGPEPTRFGDWEHKGRISDF